jgi:hypothetical protein
MRAARVGCRAEVVWLVAVLLLGVSFPGLGEGPGLQGFAAEFNAQTTGYPFSFVELHVRAAYVVSGFTVVGSVDLPYLPLLQSTFGITGSITRDWLAVGVEAVYDTGSAGPAAAVVAQAEAPALLLHNTPPILLLGCNALFRAPFAPAGSPSISLAPYFTAIYYVRDLTVSAGIGLDATTGPADATAVTGSRLQSRVDAGAVVVANTVGFSDLFGSFARLDLSVLLPALGATITASLLPGDEGAFRYGLSIRLVLGDESVLPAPIGQGSRCAGGICY